MRHPTGATSAVVCRWIDKIMHLIVQLDTASTAVLLLPTDEVPQLLDGVTSPMAIIQRLHVAKDN